MPFTHPTFTTSRGTEPGIRQRFSSDNTISYTLTGEDVNRWHLFPLQAVAEKFYQDADLWPVLADANPIREPWSWGVGDTVLVPRDYHDALEARSTDDTGLSR